MRTTLTIDDDVLAAARQKAKATDEPLGKIVSDLMRMSLSIREDPPTYEHGIRLLPVSKGGRSATLEETIALRDDSE